MVLRALRQKLVSSACAPLPPASQQAHPKQPPPTPNPSHHTPANHHHTPANHNHNDEHCLYVVMTYFNPARYHRRRELAIKTAIALASTPGVRLVIAECAPSPHHFELEDVPGAFLCVRVVASDVLWRKENLINLAVAQLPPSWHAVAWVDADITFAREDWAMAALRKLRTYDVVQLFGDAIGLDARGNVHRIERGFASGFLGSSGGYADCSGGDSEYTSAPGHPGFAWAITREAWSRTHGLLDAVCPLGGADRVMALAWARWPSSSDEAHQVPGVAKAIRLFEARTGDMRMGYIDGVVLHAWHGRLADRGYTTRWGSLREARFDPAVDLHRDSHGVLHWTATGRRLQRLAKAFFQARREDSEA